MPAPSTTPPISRRPGAARLAAHQIEGETGGEAWRRRRRPKSGSGRSASPLPRCICTASMATKCMAQIPQPIETGAGGKPFEPGGRTPRSDHALDQMEGRIRRERGDGNTTSRSASSCMSSSFQSPGRSSGDMKNSDKNSIIPSSWPPLLLCSPPTKQRRWASGAPYRAAERLLHGGEAPAT